jgi:peptidoglycan/LPS O-acetylase OafA/YrhL
MKLTYRPEIDGLRAIAVVAVIFYHAQITIFGHQPFKGGFIGVDIFFVISGYLITSIILKELVTTGTFSFKHFYERRVRRILPALLFVMLASLPFAWMYLLPSSFVDFSKSILYSLGFSSNFYFHYSGQQYGAESGLLKPFLHTWSLSVEEQYYILFPIVLLITFKYFKKHLLTILVIGLIISLQMADWGSKNYPSASFYFLHTRMWELLAGSILAYFEITLGHRSKNKTLNLILPSIGLFLIGHSILFFNDEIFHPSFYTLSPIIGVCLIIWFSSKNELITKILSTKLFVGIGLISYSLYLWHYPIFAFARIKDNTPSEYDKFEWVVLSIILSLISYFFVERPFRNKQNKFNKILLTLSIFISVVITINVYILIKSGKLSYPYTQIKSIYFYNNIFNNELRHESWKYVEKFREFKSEKKIKVLIVGDSHSKDLFNAFILNANLFKNYEFLRYGDVNKQTWFNFTGMEKKMLKKFIESEVFKKSDLIIISDYFARGIDNLDVFLKKIKNKKKIILTSNSNMYFKSKKKFHGQKLTLFDDYLIKNSKTKKHIDKNLSNHEINKINSYYFQNLNIGRLYEINNQLKYLAKKHDIQFLDKQDFQCDLNKQICYGATDTGLKSHYDWVHYTLEGAKFFGKRIFDINWFKLN